MEETVWVCADCGNPGARPIEGRFGVFAALDERYQTGYCNYCSTDNPMKPRKTARPTSQLVRMQDFNREKFDERKQRDELRELVKTFAAGKSRVQLTDKQVSRIIELYDKWGFPGWQPGTDLRAQNSKYIAATAYAEVKKPYKKQKRSRGA